MTAVTTSQNKKSFFAVRFKTKFSEDMKLFTTNLVFQLLCAPVFAGVMLWLYHMDEIGAYGYRGEYIPFLFIAVISLLLSICMGLIIPMMNFRYLYSKSLVDMNYSLPLNNRQRFFADYFAGLAAYIIPFLIGGVIAMAEILIGSCFIEMDEVIENIPYILKIGTIILAGLVMLYTMSVFAITFAGSVFEALFSIVAVNIMIPLFVFLTWENIVKAAHFGLSDKSVGLNYTFFTTSPIGVFGFIISYLDRVSFNSGRTQSDIMLNGISEYSFMNSLYFIFMLRILLVIAVLVLITFLLYKRRKAEDVSKPYVYKAFYYIVMTGAIYCIVSLMRMTTLENGIISALIISGIMWFVMEVIRRRGFKRFWTALISFAAASAAVIGIIKVIDVTDGLGRAKYVPSASKVSDVEINLSGYYGIFGYKEVFHDPAIINDIIELNNEMIDRHFDPKKQIYELSEYKMNQFNNVEKKPDKPNYLIDEQEIMFTYYTKSGTAIVRNYVVPSEMLIDLCCDMYTDKEFAEKKTKEMYYSSMREYLSINYDSYNENDESDFGTFEVRDKLGTVQNVDLSREEARELTEALCSDYTLMTADDLKASEFYCSIDDIMVNSACRNTIRFLEEHDVDYNKSAEILIRQMNYSQSITITPEPEYIFPAALYSDTNYLNYYGYNDYDMTSEYTNDCIKLGSILSLGKGRNGGYGGYKNKHYEFTNYDAVKSLIESATPVVTGEKVLAELKIGSAELYITERSGDMFTIEKAQESIRLYDNVTGEVFDSDLYY